MYKLIQHGFNKPPLSNKQNKGTLQVWLILRQLMCFIYKLYYFDFEKYFFMTFSEI